MDGESSWITHCFSNSKNKSDKVGLKSPSQLNHETDKQDSTVSVDLILPDHLLDQILAYLPIVSMFRATLVCKRWHKIVTSRSFLWNNSHLLPQKPWYFMFTSSDDPVGYAYDLVFRKWYGIDLPCIQKPNWFIVSSCGLVCFMDNDGRGELYVCNPITKLSKQLNGPPGMKYPDYSALAVSVDRKSHRYNVSIVKSKQVPGNFYEWDLSIHLYDSETRMWTTTFTETLAGWRAGDVSVICDGVLYILVYSTGGGGPDTRHGLIVYKLRDRLSHGSLMRSFVHVPCSLTCGRLMNLKEKLVMVGGIGRHDRPDIIKGIGVWVLKGREWQELARMPQKFFQGFGELDDVFASSGTDDIIFIQSYGSPALLIFYVNRKQWKWSLKCPVTKKFSLQLFTGFCFEPRLEIAP